MKFFLVLGGALSLSMSAARASAQEASARPRRFEVGLSSGYSSAGFGKTLATEGFDSLWAIPLTVDLDYRLGKHWSAGVYGELGFIDNSNPDVEDVDETIKGQHFRLGVEALYHSALERKVQPWLGVGLGYDALRATYRERSTYLPSGAVDTGDPGRSIRASGFELGHVQLGIDFALVPGFAFGPFVGASVVAYGARRGFRSTDDFNVWSNIGLKAAVHL